MKRGEEKGITIIALTVTIIVLIIIASIGISAGGNTIKTAKLESLKTNMLLIQAKAKEYVEEVSFKKGPVDTGNTNEVRFEVYEANAGLISSLSDEAPQEVKSLVSEISSGSDIQYYYVSREALDNMGLNKVEEGEKGDYYVVGFDEQNLTVEVYNTIGFKNNNKYVRSLTELEQIEEVK